MSGRREAGNTAGGRHEPRSHCQWAVPCQRADKYTAASHCACWCGMPAARRRNSRKGGKSAIRFERRQCALLAEQQPSNRPLGWACRSLTRLNAHTRGKWVRPAVGERGQAPRVVSDGTWGITSRTLHSNCSTTNSTDVEPHRFQINCDQLVHHRLPCHRARSNESRQQGA